MQFYCGGKQIVAPFIHQLTKALEDNMEERNDGSVHEAVQLVDKCLFDHLVSWNKHRPLTASPQAEHGAVLLSQLRLKTNNFSRERKMFGIDIWMICRIEIQVSFADWHASYIKTL